MSLRSCGRLAGYGERAGRDGLDHLILEAERRGLQPALGQDHLRHIFVREARTFTTENMPLPWSRRALPARLVLRDFHAADSSP
jgi:hypothetical protein